MENLPGNKPVNLVQSLIYTKGKNYVKFVDIGGEKIPVVDEIEKDGQKICIPYNYEVLKSDWNNFVRKHRMREIEKPQGIRNQEKEQQEDRVDILKGFEGEEGGFLMQVFDPKTGYIHPELYEGQYLTEMVQMVCNYKRAFPLLMKFFSQLQKHPLRLIFHWKAYKDFTLFFVEFIRFSLQQYEYDEKGYSRSVQQIYRWFKEAEKDIYGFDKELVGAIGNSICIFVEYDNAYKDRMKDLSTVFNEEAFFSEVKINFKGKARILLALFFRKPLKQDMFNPSLQEIWRVLEIWKTRDYMHDKIDQIRNSTCLFLEFKPKILKKIQEITKIIDFNKLRPNQRDLYWQSYKKDYYYWGKMTDERISWRKKNYPE